MGPSREIKAGVAVLALLCAVAAPAAQGDRDGAKKGDERAGTPAATPGASAGGTGPCPGAGTEVDRLSTGDARGALLCLVNRERRDRRLMGVREAPGLHRSAEGHSRDMVRRRYFAHARGDSTLKSRVERSGYLRGAKSGWSLGEALAYGSAGETPADLFAALLASPPHRAIIRHPRFREVGVGVVRGMPDGDDDGMTVTLNFGVRR